MTASANDPHLSAADSSHLPLAAAYDSPAPEPLVFEQPDRNADGPPAKPFQFRLRTLLALMAAAGVVFAILSHVGPLCSAVVIWGVVLVAAHVAGNVCGTQRTGAAPQRPAALPPVARAIWEIRATRLRQHHGPGLSMFVGILLGAAAGGLVGTLALWGVYCEQFGAGPVGVGGASSAVVGGFLGFLAASFMQVAKRAWHEATWELRRRR